MGDACRDADDPMSSFACASCGLELPAGQASENPPLACPRCGQPLAAEESLPATVIVATPPNAPWLEANIRESAMAPGSASTSGHGYDFLEPAQADDELGRLGPYRVLRVVGTGGMGVVFEAEDLGLRRRVAIKALLPAVAERGCNRERFLREAQATASIEHEHIVTIYQVGEHHNIPYMVMQFLQGESLETRLLREVRLPVVETLRIARETATALAAAHECLLVHRDVKPANIWLESRGQGSGVRGLATEGLATSALIPDSWPLTPARVKLLDFGLARMSAEDTKLTRVGVILGTPAYMSPEQARGKVVDHLGDLFSLGCVLFQMCTGQLPFKGADVMSRLVSLVIDEPPPLYEIAPDVPPALSDLVLHLLAKDPAQRPASARVVIDTLTALQARLGPLPGAPSSSAQRQVAADSSLDLFKGTIVSLQDEPAETEPEPTAESEDVVPPMGLEQPVEHLEDLAGNTLGRFELGPVLARGYHGITFRANDLKYAQPVALKVFFPAFPQDAEEAERFVRFTKALLTLRHPNLTAVTAVGRMGPYCWLAAELIEGEDLLAIMQRERQQERPDWRLAFRLAVHLARAMQCASQHHLRHGFLTPQNVLAPSGDTIFKLADLMLHHALKGSALRRSVRRDKQLAEAVYTAPELLESRGSRDDIGDLYSVGVMVYQLLTGRLPFEGDTPKELVQHIHTTEPTRPRKLRKSVPSAFEKVVLQLLHKDRKSRLQTPTELLTYLDRIAQEQGVEV
jgi:serine/threonine protein kinase